jgi:hypothetical protein
MVVDLRLEKGDRHQKEHLESAGHPRASKWGSQLCLVSHVRLSNNLIVQGKDGQEDCPGDVHRMIQSFAHPEGRKVLVFPSSPK